MLLFFSKSLWPFLENYSPRFLLGVRLRGRALACVRATGTANTQQKTVLLSVQLTRRRSRYWKRPDDDSTRRESLKEIAGRRSANLLPFPWPKYCDRFTVREREISGTETVHAVSSRWHWAHYLAVHFNFVCFKLVTFKVRAATAVTLIMSYEFINRFHLVFSFNLLLSAQFYVLFWNPAWIQVLSYTVLQY